ncbi:MAG: hypothetical protein DRH56_02675, partial [Deltaproteobacteria bacterium]
IHVFSPCPTGWRFPPAQLIEVGRKAVQTNIVPLWEFNNQDRSLRFTHPVDNPLPVEEYLRLIRKYSHLSKEQIVHIQKRTDEQIEMLKHFEGEKLETSEAVAV